MPAIKHTVPIPKPPLIQMMLGEHHRINPTVHIPPWPSLDDPQPEIFSTHKYDAAADDCNSPIYLQEAVAALQRYLPSNDVDSDSDFSGMENPDSPVDAYSCDHFRMYEFKIRKCPRGRSHDWTECPYAHPGEKARRRDPRKFHYSGTSCPEFRKGSCRKGDSCEFAHGVFECWLHPARYRTQPCKDGPGCRRRVCFFAHSPDQMRVVNSADSPSSTKTLSFWSGSGSPPMSPRADSSPPMSPMARSLGNSSINDVVASLRNLQLGKLKSISPSSWNSSSSPVFGSPRGPVTRPGFFSLPTTPTARNPARPGYLDFWDKSCEEEPVMERVESGRDLRAKMFEKLSKENSLGRVDEMGLGSGAPDVDWVSDLVE